MHASKFRAQIGAVSMPEAVSAIGTGEYDPRSTLPSAAELPPRRFEPRHDPRLFPAFPEFPSEIYRPFCRTDLTEGCYRLLFTPTSSFPSGRISLFATRYRGTLRVERVDSGYRISGDLYRYSLLDLLVLREAVALRTFAREGIALADDAADDGSSTIPIYKRRDYHSYLEGTSASMWSFGKCRFTLGFDEWTYNHPTTGFNGSFDGSPARSISYRFEKTSTDGFYTGVAFEGSTMIGTVSIRHVSPFFRRATLQVDTLDTAQAPPTSVPAAGGGTEDFRSIFATAGWDLTVNFASSTVSLPASLAGIDPADCDNWDFDSRENLHDVMESVPSYEPSGLDMVWRAHLVTVPAELGCSRGRMFDSGLADGVDREGAATFSHDGYPSTDQCPFGTPSAYGSASDDRQLDHPRAFLRSAAHEVGHTFNQIHQSFEGGNDNSIMTVTPCVATVIDQAGGSFPEDIDLAFNATVRQHLIHLPDPAVRPGAMDFFGSAINAPEPADVNLLEDLSLEVTPSSTRVRLGEPLPVKWTLRNDGDRALPVPERVDAESLTARISVTDPRGRTTFMRPVALNPCTGVPVGELGPNEEVEGEATVFYGRDGFTFEEPGRHTVHVVILWELGGAHLAAAGDADVWVAYPLTDKDNQIAALMLDPQVGRAVATRKIHKLDEAKKRIRTVASLQKTHPACTQLKRLGLI